MSRQHLTVEVFRDVVSPNVATDPLIQGVGYVNQIVGGMEVVRDDRRIFLAPEDLPILRADKIRWPDFTADINLIASDRGVVPREEDMREHQLPEEALAGMSWVQRVGKKVTRVAVVSNLEWSTPDYDTAHEVGHMFRIKPKPNPGEELGHCGEDTCLMHYRLLSMSMIRRVPRTGFGGLLERQGLLPPQTENMKMYCGTTFCDHCTDQLGMRGFFMKKAKAGEAVPLGLLGL